LFDGVNDYLTTPNLFNPISDTFSISLWINVDGSSSGPRPLVSQNNGSGIGRLILFVDGNSKLRSNLGIGTTSGFAGATTVTADSWRHVVFTFDGATARIYLDGVLDGEGPVIGEAATGALTIATNKGALNFFPGMMDEVAFYGNVLDSYAIYALAQTNGYGVGDVNVGFEVVDFAVLTDTITTTANFGANFDSFMATWYTATVPNPGQPLSDWTLTNNDPLENFYTIQLRSDDANSNQSSIGAIWRGLIDRVAPTVIASGQHLGRGSAAQTEYTFTFSDFLLDIDSFVQPCPNGALVSLTYDDPILPHDGVPYEVTAVCRVQGHELSRTFTTCDTAGHCTDETVNLIPSPQLSSVAILTPTEYIPVSGTNVNVPIGGGAYAADDISDIAVLVDGSLVDTLTYPTQWCQRYPLVNIGLAAN
jgi:hypothetical protein